MLPPVALIGSDPLARRALAASLGVEDVSVAEVGPGEMAPESVEVVLFDDGPSGVGMLRPAPDAPQPWLALVSSGPRARAAMSGGFRGAIGRDASPETLVAAIGALRQGLVTIDERFAGDLLPAHVTHEPLALTPREREVLELLAEGLSNKEIAAQLGVSPHTAKFHVTALLDKLGAETRTEAVVLAARAGLLTL
ncbi:MAG: response regulator transcription factor [Myxococcota bacterium]